MGREHARQFLAEHLRSDMDADTYLEGAISHLSLTTPDETQGFEVSAHHTKQGVVAHYNFGEGEIEWEEVIEDEDKLQTRIWEERYGQGGAQ